MLVGIDDEGPAYSGIVVDWLGVWPYYCSYNILLSPGSFA